MKECVFRWSDLPRLSCGVPGGALRTLPVEAQQLDVAFICQTARIATNQFNNNRYVVKYHKSGKHPFRKLSLNRLQQL